MATDGSDFLIEYRAVIERRVREQVERHQGVNPNTDPRRVVEIQMKQERERLERLIAADETTPDQVDVFRQLLEWLPQLERQMTGRR